MKNIKKISLILLLIFSVNSISATSSAKPTTFTLSFSEVVTGLIANAYSEISLPPGYIPSINVLYYPGTVLHLFYKSATNSYVEVYKFTSAITAENAATPTQCTQKWHSSGDSPGCYDSGNECKVIGNADPEKIKVICC